MRKIFNGLDLQHQRIILLGDPQADTDAASKKYVDTRAGSGLRRYAVNIGDTLHTSFVLVHNFGTKDVFVSVRDRVTDDEVYPDIHHTSTNNVTLVFRDAPITNAYRVVVIG